MNPPKQELYVAVVEDVREERETLVRMLAGADGFHCVAACASAEDALRVIPSARPDVVLMDIQLPATSGIECVRQLKALSPETEMMMLTVVEDHEQIFESLAAGATGYLLKTTTPTRLLEAIRELHAGGAPMSGQIARQVIAEFQRPAAPAPAANLSPVEQKVLQHLARGLLYKEVADELKISISTIRTHIWHIYKKLHVHNRTEAVLKGLPKRTA